MEAPTWAAYAVALLAAITLVQLTNHLLLRRKLNLPPGPKPWPIIGNFNLIGPLPHHSIDKLSKKYGPIMMLKYGSVPVLVGSSVEMAKCFLKTNDVIFAGRPQNAAGKYTTYNYSDITWCQYGPYWRQARKICLMELFNVKRLESYEYIRVEELNSVLKGLYNINGESTRLKDHLFTLNLNVISRMVLGKKYLEKNDDEKSVVTIEEFKVMLDELFLLNGVLNLGDWIPCIKYLDVQGYVKRMKILAKKFDKFLEHVLDEHNARREKEKDDWVAKDMVDVLLQLADDPNLEVKLERIGVKAFCQDLVAGGTESSIIIVEWAISELLRKPEIFAKATEELDRVIGKNRWVEEKDIKNLPYIRAIVKETMRLHPVAPMLSPRLAREQVQIKGYDIPKGSIVLVNTFTIQRDPNVYQNPEEFWPERFVGNDIDVKGHNFELLPFGSGRRMCPGYSLGLKIIESSLANILHGFEWKLPGNMKVEDLNMDEICGLSNPKKIPLTACAQPRLPRHIYHM
ncbi:trimethyltridecatetraene synthase-like [Spinacia oleracea]|uniref:Trimethyltridecatetraene synthase-like n=1 Tax=Spinacia oleracea TaxID=3562 RepID=A0A9R0JAN2_SPIOL|nr:trimethyltridecatetraene synthase-like [Spinacia oleracea]